VVRVSFSWVDLGGRAAPAPGAGQELQGFLFSPAIPAAELAKMLAATAQSVGALPAV